MANFVSPGVYVIEKDISDYAPSINTSVVGIVGFAGKGPVNKATLITSQNNLLDTFGSPSENIYGQGLEGALEILEQTNAVYYVRASSDAAANASATASFGSCPSVIVSGPQSSMPGDEFGVGSSIYFKIQVYDNSGVAQYDTPKKFAVPAGTVATTATGASQAKALKKIIGGDLDSDAVGCFSDGNSQEGLDLSGAIVGSWAGSGASIGVSAYGDSTYNDAGGISALMCVSATSGINQFGASVDGSIPLASSVRAYGATYLSLSAQTSGANYLMESRYPGAGYNFGNKTDGAVSGNQIQIASLGGPNWNINTLEDGQIAEQFKVSLLASGNFVEDQINTGATNVKSNYITGNLRRSGIDVALPLKLNQFSDMITALYKGGYTAKTQFLHPPSNPTGAGTATANLTTSPATGRWIKMVERTIGMTGGDDGTGSTADNNTALIGNANVTPKTGMQSLDDDVLNIGIALVPGIYNQSVQNNLITLAERTQNFIALLSPPYAIGTPQDAIDWTNGRSSSTAGSRTAAINSSYAAVYYPHVKVFSVFDSKDRWFDPSIYAARQMAYTDTVADSWFAPAGFRRGRLTKPVDVEVKLNQGDRDSLYSGGNVVNPIVSFPQRGITIFGQRTAQRSPTALDRINVRRLMIYIRKIILAATQRFVFEPNDPFTWSQVEGVLNPFLDDIRRRRGIVEFRVVCDDTVNTPLRIDRNEMWTKVLVKPTKTAEILVFEVNLTNQAADLGKL
jgi:phage tail sheath protein FI